jgi:isochorismate synthase EntC
VPCNRQATARAGTRARGPSNSEEDLALGRELMREAKDDNEFGIVRDSVHANIRRLCTASTVDNAKTLLKLSTVQHLYSNFSGRLRRSTGDPELLVRPRAAACASPRYTTLHNMLPDSQHT